MAYVPPHLRHSKTRDSSSSSISPARPPLSVTPRSFNKNPGLKSTGIVFAENSISKWFLVGLTDEGRVSDCTRLELYEQRLGRKSLALVLNENGDKEISEFFACPWVFVVDTIKQEFLTSFENVKALMSGYEAGEIKPYIILRFGKIVFNGNPEHLHGKSLAKSELNNLSRSFYTNIPSSYKEYVTSNVVKNQNLEHVDEKCNLYRIMLSDNSQPCLNIWCKCALGKETNQLELYKIKSNALRHLISDMACINKTTDLRISLSTRKISVSLTGEELESLKSLIKLAVPDDECEGGLRWPFGKRFGDRYTVISTWRTSTKTFKNSSMKLKIRSADRFSFVSSYGEITEEISIKLSEIVAQLEEQAFDSDVAVGILKENLEFIWKHFLK